MMLKPALLVAALCAISLSASAAETQTVTLNVKGMHCGTCPLTVRQLLKNQPGVSNVKVNAEAKTAEVEFDPAKVAPEALAKATTDAGYPAAIKK